MIFFAVFPAGLGALFTGPLIDRWDRRKLFIGANLVASLGILAMAVLYFTGSLTLWHLYVAMSINGIASAFISPAMQSSARLLVPKEKLNRASGLSQLVRPLEAILAPSLAGLIVGAFGLEIVFIIDVITFLVNILILSMIHIPRPAQTTEQAGRIKFWAELSAGFKYIQERPAFVTLLSLFAFTLFLLPGMAYSLITPMVLSFETEKTLGLVLSAYGVGSIIGGVFLASQRGTRRRMNGILTALVVAGVAAILIGLWENPWTIGFGVFLTGLSFVFVTGLNQVIWQVKSAPEMQGRLFALMGTLAVGGQSLGILLAGPLASRVFQPILEKGGVLANSIGTLIGTGSGRGMAFMFILLGLTVLGTALVSWLNPAIRLLEDQLPDHEGG
jgi:MFS family permease